MRKVIIIICLIVILVISIGYTTVYIKLNNVKANIKEQNPKITEIESISNLGQWGEWFLEYSLVVVMDGEKYRVWTNGNGVITDKVQLD